MKCTNCGADIIDGAKFCGQCGFETDRPGTSTWLPPGAAAPTGKIVDRSPVEKVSSPDIPLASTKSSPKTIRAKDQTSEAIGGGCALLLLVGVLYSLTSMCSTKPPSPEEIKADQAKAMEDQRQGFHCLSTFDGSNRDFVNKVKDQLRDPDSFEIIETRIAPTQDDKHFIAMKYRARNGFGGMNVETAIGFVNHSTCDSVVTAVGE